MYKVNNNTPKDLVAQLVENYRADKPLLTDVVLYRGSRLPDQTQGTFSQNEMHASLLPQVAASYTHNWQEKDSFIGTYKIDRENTRFYADYGLEQKLQGKDIRSYSVAEVERGLTPLVADVAEALNSKQRLRAEEALETFIKRSFYEASVPTKTPDGGPNRPDTLYIYKGRPDISIRQAISMQMEKMTPANEQRAKDVMYREHRNEAAGIIHTISVENPAAVKSFQVLAKVAQRGYGEEMAAKHGSKPLNQFMDALAAEPVNSRQAQLGRLAKVLAQGLQSSDPTIQSKATAVINRLSTMDGDKVSFEEVVRASSASAAGVSSTKSQTAAGSMTSGRELER